MAVSDSYAAAADYRTAIGMTDTSKDTAILADLTLISRHLEGRLGRFFAKDAAAVARVYLPAVAADTLWVDDLSAAPTSIKLDTAGDGSFTAETALASTDYELLPLNADKGPEPRPWTRIRLVPWGTKSSFLTTQRVQVTAAFGWPSVPGPIKAATIQLAAILRIESPRATTRIAELDQAIQATPEAQRIIDRLLDPYQRVVYI